jgi:formamidopyrimidine-DNA glycosylase
MPELPEVETIRRGLEPVRGRSIASATFGLPRLILGSKAGELTRQLRGQRIDDVLRRGKYLVLKLDRDILIVHLGMTGQLTHAPAKAVEDPRFLRTVTGMQKPLGVHPVDKHTHAILHLDDGSRVQFRDPRTFGKIIFIVGHEWEKNPRIRILGEEPLELKIPAFLKKHFPSNSRRPVKALLLDQSFVAGVGNIYADEALFASGIHPKTLVASLQVAETTRLLNAVKTVLKKGIRYQGTTFSDYRKPDGSSGDNYERLMVYGRGGRPCRSCGTPLVKIVVAQRGTVFCPRCQPLHTGKGRAKGSGKKHATLKTMDKVRRPSHN